MFAYVFTLFVGVGHICHLLLAYIIVEVIVLMAGGDEHTGEMRRGDEVKVASIMRKRIIDSAGLTHHKVQYVSMFGKARQRPQHVVIVCLKFRRTSRRYEPSKLRVSTI